MNGFELSSIVYCDRNATSIGTDSLHRVRTRASDISGVYNSSIIRDVLGIEQYIVACATPLTWRMLTGVGGHYFNSGSVAVSLLEVY
jgi:hypothetical protein